MSWLVDPAQKILTNALDGLAQRQQLISANLSNIDTPGYEPQAVDFESALQEEAASMGQVPGSLAAPHDGPSAAFGLRTTDPRHIATTATLDSNGNTASTGFAGTLRNDGNKVDVESEMTALSDTQIKYSAVSRLLNSKFSQLLDVVGGR